MDLVWKLMGKVSKPIVVDVDTLGALEHVPLYVTGFRNAGAYAIVMEDKKFPKMNSLIDGAKHQMEDVDLFCEKIKTGKKHAGPMKIIARLESLIALRSMEEALIRADAYVKAGVDMILIHSKQSIQATEVMEFARRFRETSSVPLACIPTTYKLPEDHPFSLVVIANHMFRASLKAMQRFVSGEEVELASVEEVFELIGK